MRALSGLPVRRSLEACSPAERSASREYIWIIQDSGARLRALFTPCAFNFFGENLHACFNLLRVRHIVHAHALMRVRPRLIQAREEVVARHHQDAALFQALVQQLGRNRQILKPQLEENRPFRLMNQAAIFR